MPTTRSPLRHRLAPARPLWFAGLLLCLALAGAGLLSAAPAQPAAVDLSVAWSGPAAVAPGAEVTYTLTLSNAGPEDAAGVQVTGTFPAPLVVLRSSPGAQTLPTGRTWLTGSVQAGATRVLTVTVAVPANLTVPQTLGLVAEVTSTAADSQPPDNVARLDVAFAGADLRVLLDATAPTVRAGERMTHTLTVANVSPREAQGLVVTATLAPGTEFVADTAAESGFARTLLPGAVRWTRARFNGPTTSFIDLVTQVSAAELPDTLLGSSVIATSATLDEVPANNHASAEAVRVVLPALWLAKTGPAEAPVGAEIEYTLRFGNRGSGAARAVAVTDTLPAGLTYVRSTPPALVTTEGRLTWATGPLPVGDEGLLRVWARVNADTLPGAALVNQAAIDAGGVEADRADNSASIESRVVPGAPADVQVTAAEVLPVSETGVALTVAVADVGGNPVANGTPVELSATLGQLGATSLTTHGGTVATTFTPGRTPGKARLRAIVGSVETEREVTLQPGAPATIRLLPSHVNPTVEDAVTLQVQVVDAFDNPVVDGTPVTLLARPGSFNPPSFLTSGGAGQAGWVNTLAAQSVVTATAGTVSATLARNFRPGLPNQLTLSTDQAQLPVEDGVTTVRATVRDRYSNLVDASPDVRFTATGGTLTPISAKVLAGQAQTSFRAGKKPGNFEIVGRSGSLSAMAPIVLRGADLSLALAEVRGPRGRASETQTYPGEPLTYTLVVQNAGPATARGVVLGASGPAVWQVSERRLGPGVTDRPAVPPKLLDPPTADRAQQAWTLTDLPPGASRELVLTGRLDRDHAWTGQDNLFFRSAVTTTTAVEQPEALSRTDSATVFGTDLYVNITLDSLASQLVPGGLALYVVKFGNHKPLADTGRILITDTLPTWMSFDHWQAAQGTKLSEASPFHAAARTLVWEPQPPFGISESFKLWLAIDPSAPADALFENLVRIGAQVPDVNLRDNVASDGGVALRGVNLVAGLQGAETAVAGELLAHDLTVSNTSRQDPARNVVVDSYPPAGLVIEGSEPPGVLDPVQGRVRWQLESLLPGLSRTFTVRLRVPANAAVGSTLRHRLEVSGDDVDRYPTDNSAEHVTRVVPGSPARIALTAGRSTLVACGAEASATLVSAELRDARGNLVADGTTVTWSTTGGTLSAPTSTTAAGIARVTLSAAGEPGLAQLTAQAGTVTERLALDIVPGPPATIAVTALPDVLPPGGSSTIQVDASDACGLSVADRTPLRLAAERGSFDNGSASLTLNTLAGRVSARLRVGAELGPLAVVARYDAVSGQTVLDVSASAATATPTPTEVPTALPPRLGIYLPFVAQRQAKR